MCIFIQNKQNPAFLHFFSFKSSWHHPVERILEWEHRFEWLSWCPLWSPLCPSSRVYIHNNKTDETETKQLPYRNIYFLSLGNFLSTYCEIGRPWFKHLRGVMHLILITTLWGGLFVYFLVVAEETQAQSIKTRVPHLTSPSGRARIQTQGLCEYFVKLLSIHTWRY